MKLYLAGTKPLGGYYAEVFDDKHEFKGTLGLGTLATIRNHEVAEKCVRAFNAYDDMIKALELCQTNTLNEQTQQAVVAALELARRDDVTYKGLGVDKTH